MNWRTKLMSFLGWFRVVAIGGFFSPIPSQMFFSKKKFVRIDWVLQ